MTDQDPTPEESPGAQATGDDAETVSAATAPSPAPPTEQDAEAAAPAPPGGGLRWTAVLALLGLAGLLGLESAGLLLRDRLEQRRTPLSEAPAMLGETEGATAAAVMPGARFGPDVKEVTVAAGAVRPAPAPRPDPPPPQVDQEPAPAPPPAEAPKAAPESAARPDPAPPVLPAPAKKTSTGPATAPVAAAGTHALQVGIFGSQRYRHDMERRLAKAGFPHFRGRRSKQGEGYLLSLALADGAQRVQAQAVLAAKGYLSETRGETVEAYFHFEEDAQRALQELSGAGFNGGYARTRGELPLWVVYAGPFPLAEAKQARQQLAIQGLPSYLRKAP